MYFKQRLELSRLIPLMYSESDHASLFELRRVGSVCRLAVHLDIKFPPPPMIRDPRSGSHPSSPWDMKTVRASWSEKEEIHHWPHVNIAAQKSIHHGPHSASPNSHHSYNRGSIDAVFLLLPASQFAPPS